MNITDQDPAAQRQIFLSKNFQPLDDRILVERIDEDDTASIIIVPELAAVPSRKAVVVACGPGKRTGSGGRIPVDVRPGDIVVFGRFTDFDNGRLLLIQEADVVGVCS
jgi:chaperonin GroES